MIGDFDVIFSDFFGWDWGTHAILRQNLNKITVLYGCGFGVKKIGLGQKKTLLGQNPNFVRKFVLKAPLMNDGRWVMNDYNQLTMGDNGFKNGK